MQLAYLATVCLLTGSWFVSDGAATVLQVLAAIALVAYVVLARSHRKRIRSGAGS
jgi:hypothetical protein